MMEGSFNGEAGVVAKKEAIQMGIPAYFNIWPIKEYHDQRYTP